MGQSSLKSEAEKGSPIGSRAHACTHVCTHVCSHVYAHVYTHVDTHVCTHVYTHVCTHVDTHVYTHVYTPVCVDICVPAAASLWIIALFAFSQPKQKRLFDKPTQTETLRRILLISVIVPSSWFVASSSAESAKSHILNRLKVIFLEVGSWVWWPNPM